MILPFVLSLNFYLRTVDDNIEKKVSNYQILKNRDGRLNGTIKFYSGRNDSVTSMKSIFLDKLRIRLSTNLLNHLRRVPMPIPQDDLYFFRVYSNEADSAVIMDGVAALSGFRWYRLQKKNKTDSLTLMPK